MINNLEVVEYVKETGISYHFDSNVIVLVLFIMVQNVFLYLLYEKYCKLRNDVLTLDDRIYRENETLNTRINKEVFELHNKIDAEVAQNLHFCDLKIEQEFLDRIKVIDAKIEQYNYKHRLRIDEKFIENSLLIEQKVQAQINSIEYEYDEELTKTLDETQTKLIELTETVEKSKINIVPFGTNDYIDFNSTKMVITTGQSAYGRCVGIKIDEKFIVNEYGAKEIEHDFLKQFKNVKILTILDYPSVELLPNQSISSNYSMVNYYKSKEEVLLNLLNVIFINNKEVKIVYTINSCFKEDITTICLFNVFMKSTKYTCFDLECNNVAFTPLLNDFKNYLKTHNIKSNLLI